MSVRRFKTAKATVTLAATLAVISLAACSGVGSSASSTSPTTGSSATGPGSVTRTYCDPATPIVVPLGQEFAIALGADASTGSGWQPVAPPDPAVILSMGTEFPATARATGSGSCAKVGQVLRYGGRGPGSATITLRYGRPGTPPVATDRTLTFSVTVAVPGAVG